MPSFFASKEILALRERALLSTDPIELNELAKSKDKLTRYAVARNENTPVVIIRRFSKDKDWGYRLAVAKNPATPRKIKNVLAEDSEWMVREAVN